MANTHDQTGYIAVSLSWVPSIYRMSPRDLFLKILNLTLTLTLILYNPNPNPELRRAIGVTSAEDSSQQLGSGTAHGERMPLRIRMATTWTQAIIPPIRVRVRVRGGYLLRLHTPFSIVGVMPQPHSLG